ncbi:MAG: hypothetical protein IT321_16725 [Anaerolineae bacterium]|nr:hypothetical protein [Anaerolineae bacterium]
MARTRCLASLQAWSGVWGWWAYSRAPYGVCEGESVFGLVARTRCLASLQAWSGVWGWWAHSRA